jgi:hypothetical protein
VVVAKGSPEAKNKEGGLVFSPEKPSRTFDQLIAVLGSVFAVAEGKNLALVIRKSDMRELPKYNGRVSDYATGD